MHFILFFPGGYTGEVTPVPIPNTEVKPVRADDTARLPVWESRKSPDLFQTKSPLQIEAGFFHFKLAPQIVLSSDDLIR